MDEARRCTGKSTRRKSRCNRAAILGGTVCPTHGGQLPRVKAKAKERLLAAEAIKAWGLGQARDPERVMAELACIAFSQLSDRYGPDGKLLALADMPAHVQAALSDSDTVTGNVDKGDGQKDALVRVRVWDKPKALEMLAKHHGLLTETVEHRGAIEIKWQE